ncbi:UDP-N-acetylmuramoyl-tripeptide--D-alanyl-D-alanine ligase [Thioclava litoralis]|uniref:UDP-N-acetylmuramoyl-tripeptide--D-alanyl-D-alanine ligase n=2 Tax=Thioclava litoralis TaxID=3076557 RepID=A0ABZ1E1Z2_9RHOB|nr:UDP-N-acetylmuramoyl-tripeptide--D-alanyl-D-alanine ligase [Thioclava sp. FTW29]
MMTLWTTAEIARATRGRATLDAQIGGISIDTRTIARGDLFVALTAARDGHDFVRQALDKGAGAALVSRIPEGCSEADPLVLVADVLEGLQDLGRAGRARSGAKVIAVTGSVGKTSTKEMLREVLKGQGKTHAAEASFNNHWGVPITLARLPADADFAVIEIGMNHPGEIAPLARMARPHVAMITTVAAAHLAAFDDLFGIAREKAAIFEGLEPGGTCVVPLGLEVSDVLVQAAKAAGEVVTFGADEAADYRLVRVDIHGDTTVVQADARGQDLLFKVQSPGRHFASNALGAIAACAALGCEQAVAAIDLGHWVPPAGRGTRERVLFDPINPEQGIDLFDDAFNANPTSMAVALEMLAAQMPQDGVGRVKHGRRVAILGEMLELGPSEAEMHAGLARLAPMASIDVVHMVGPRMAALRDALPAAKRGEWYETAQDMVSRVRHLVDAGDVILVKGSKGSKVSLVVEALRKLGQPVSTEV